MNHHHNVYVVRTRTVQGARASFSMVAVFTAEKYARNYIRCSRRENPGAVYIVDRYNGHTGKFVEEITS
jgi:hypothetical protein